MNIDIAELYESASDDEQRYIQNVALFLTGFLGVHLKVRGAWVDFSRRFEIEWASVL